MSALKSPLITFAIGIFIGGAAILLIGVLYLNYGGDKTSASKDEHCIIMKDTVAKFVDNPTLVIGHYRDWTLASDMYKTQALNIPKDVVNSMFQLLKNSPMDADGMPRLGLRIYYGSTTPISTTEPRPDQTRMVVWPLNNLGDMDMAFPTTELPVLNVPLKFELPCPQYCD